MREVQADLIQDTQALLQQALIDRDAETATMLGTLLEQLTNGYASLTAAAATVIGGMPIGMPEPRQGWGKSKGFASPRQPVVQLTRTNAPQRQPQARPQPPQPQSYVYADGFQGVELPLGTDRDELPEGDYWEKTQG